MIRKGANIMINESFTSEELQEPLKVSILREELVKLTNDSNKAIVLNQFLYWSERTKTATGFVREEIERIKRYTENNDTSVLSYLAEDLKQGWIYKSATDLIQDTLLTISKATMNRIIADLVANQWILRRKNPRYKGDNTPQYRVNLFKLQLDLYSIGYSLNGYRLIMNVIDYAKVSELKNSYEQKQNSKKNSNDNSTQNESGPNQDDSTSAQNESTINQNEPTPTQNDTTLPEITNKDYTKGFEEEEEKRNKHKGVVKPSKTKVEYQTEQNVLNKLVNTNPKLTAVTKYLFQQGVELDDIAPIIIFLNDNHEYINQTLIAQQAERNRRIGSSQGLFSYSDYFINGLVKFSKNLELTTNYDNEEEFRVSIDGEIPKVSIQNWLE